MTRPPVAYDARQRKRRPNRIKPDPRSGGATGPGPALAVRGIEAVQVVQALDNSVRLVAGKPTLVRVYLEPPAVSATMLVTGELGWRRGTAGITYLPALNRVAFRPGLELDLETQRGDLELSLNFRLPAEAIAAGRIEIHLQRLTIPGGPDVPWAGAALRVLDFHAAPVLRVRAIGLRYRDQAAPQRTVTPAALHFAYLRSFLLRAYPVAAIDWSQLVVDADLLRPPFVDGASDLANAQLAALRAREISSGIDPRTHYYGLVDDDQGRTFMRGSTLYDRQTKIFGLVASGPCGVPNGWSGDADASYADWYGAHELGHSFQRRHPGFPGEKQPRDPDEPGFPYPEGRISKPDPRHVGLDIGDPELGLPMRAIDGQTWHDVMTYADRQWLSAYTYEAIFEQLLYEETALAPAVG